jgi:hypothetical protein
MTVTRRILTALVAVILPATVTATPSPAMASTYGLSGDNYVFVRSVDRPDRRLTVDLVQWFWGKAAVRACKQDGQPDGQTEWCWDYYYRNRSTRLRTLDVDPDAPISVIGYDGGSRTGTFADLTADSGRPYRVTVTRGRITAVAEVYVP